MIDMHTHHRWNLRRVDELRRHARQQQAARSTHPARHQIANWLRITAERIEPSPRPEPVIP